MTDLITDRGRMMNILPLKLFMTIKTYKVYKKTNKRIKKPKLYVQKLYKLLKNTVENSKMHNVNQYSITEYQWNVRKRIKTAI